MVAPAARGWLVAVGVLLVLAQAALVVAWWQLPVWCPQWVVEYSPWPAPALRAVASDDSSDGVAYHVVEDRIAEWGPAIGPALRAAFAAGTREQRREIIGLGIALAGHDGIRVATSFPPGKGHGFTPEAVTAVREDLYQLVVESMADRASSMANNAAFLASRLRDRRVVPLFCEHLRGRTPPIVSQDLDPVVDLLGELGDERAVPFLIPLLPIRHLPNPVVERAVNLCLGADSLEHVLAATGDPHPAIRTWAGAQLSRYPASSELGQRLLTLLRDPEPMVRVAAIAAVAAADFTAAIPEVSRLAQDDSDPLASRAAITALQRLTRARAAPTTPVTSGASP